MDFLVGGFAQARLGFLSEAQLQAFEVLLKIPDPQLEGLILGKASLDGGESLQEEGGSSQQDKGLAEILGLIQDFHEIRA